MSRPDEKPVRRFEAAEETLKFEIELFWKRSVFFWGFIAAAFVAFSSLYNKEQPLLVTMIACFGFICSFAWTLVNRGSKYWQDNWQQKLAREATDYFGEESYFFDHAPVPGQGSWLRGRPFSVSKLTIALSDFTVVVWSLLLLWLMIGPKDLPVEPAKIALAAISLSFAVLMFVCGRSSGARRR
ncbi:MAG: hypothetical protein QOF14_969 [Hyphomicrobiales bacterium]|jgi:hypothetical protein|nr:hypothetical protein [Hyphomicrobiales bacterium]